MSSVDTALQPSVARDQTRTLFGQTMGLVAVTVGLFALGAYLGRDLPMSSFLVTLSAYFGQIDVDDAVLVVSPVAGDAPGR